MERSLAARLTRPLASPAPRSPARARAPRRARPASSPRRPPAGARRLTRPARAGLALLREHRRVRIALLSVVLALPVLAGGWLWLRDSSLVSVQRVRVSGVHGPDAPAIEAALVSAGLHMSTLDVRSGTLRAAVAPFAVVREVRAIPSFPHGLRIDVVEQLPVAALVVGNARTAVAADGVVLGPALLSSSLPTVTGYSEPEAGRRVRGPSLLASLTVLGAAPAPLARFVARAFSGPFGLTVAMRNGLLAYFGDATRPHAKWFSLARVLADPSATGASYVDVRLPARPAAGFPAGVQPGAGASTSATGTSATGTSASEQTSTSETTVAALAAGLTTGSGAGAPGAAGASSSTGSEAAAEPSQASSAPGGEASPGATPSGG